MTAARSSRFDGSRVLVIDDEPRVAEMLSRRAPEIRLIPAEGSDGTSRFHARSWSEAARVLASGRPPDAVVLDLRFDVSDEKLLPDCRALGESASARRIRRDRRDRQGLFILERIRRLHPDLPILLMTAVEDLPFEDEALRLRADGFAYAVGPEEASAEGILSALRRVLGAPDEALRTGRFYWGKSPVMRELRRRIAALAPTPMPLLVLGETGSGKNLLVREVIHPSSGRKGPLVAFDCSTVPEGLLAASLFGAVRGAYTGAFADRAGVFEAAREGTLFLDEIENLAADAQKMLLTAVNDGAIRRVGAPAEIRHSARIVAASNADLRRRVADGAFRSDLWMRLNPALSIALPRLADRRDDLDDLADLAAESFFADPVHRFPLSSAVRAAGGADPLRGKPAFLRDEDAVSSCESPAIFLLPRKAWKAMGRHEWPGNLRQFDMVISDLLATALYGSPPAARDARGRVLFRIDPRLAFDLLAQAGAAAGGDARPNVSVPRADSIASFRTEMERTVYRTLFREAKGDFGRISEILTGSPRQARAARLRFNRLGLSAREEK